MKFSDIELPSNRKIGFFFSVVFLLLAAYFFSADSANWAAIFIFLSLVFSLVAITKPALLLPLNKLWMRLGLLLGMIVSPIVLGLIFFLIFTPVGFFMRLAGRDELLLKFKSANSYWKPRQEHSDYSDSFKHQF